MKKLSLILIIFLTILCAACKRSYKVTFKINDENTEYQIIVKGDTITDFTPTYTGHSFICWTYEDEEFDVNTKINDNITLYAKWVKNDYTITFLSDGNIIKEETLEYGDLIKEPELEMEKDEYLFLGWFKDGQEFLFNTKIEENIELSAKWVKDSEYKIDIKISFNSTGAKTEYEDIIVKRLDEIPSLPAPAYDGHEFLGWYLGDTKIEEGDILKEIKDFTLIAKWK